MPECVDLYTEVIRFTINVIIHLEINLNGLKVYSKLSRQ